MALPAWAGMMGGMQAPDAFGQTMGLFNTASDIYTQSENIHEMRQNRRFQRDMANSAHQREAEDLLKAGLNPALSLGHPGSATPGGSYSPQSAVHLDSGLGAKIQMPQLLNAAFQMAQIDDVKAAASLKRLEGGKVFGETLMQQPAIDTQEERTKLIREQLKRLQSDNQTSALGMNELKADSKMHGNWFGRNIVPYVDYTAKTIGSALGLAQGINNLRLSNKHFDLKEKHYGFDGD